MAVERVVTRIDEQGRPMCRPTQRNRPHGPVTMTAIMVRTREPA